MAELVTQSISTLVPQDASGASMQAGVTEKEEQRKKLNTKIYDHFARESAGHLKMTDEQEVALQRGYLSL